MSDQDSVLLIYPNQKPEDTQTERMLNEQTNDFDDLGAPGKTGTTTNRKKGGLGGVIQRNKRRVRNLTRQGKKAVKQVTKALNTKLSDLSEADREMLEKSANVTAFLRAVHDSASQTLRDDIINNLEDYLGLLYTDKKIEYKDFKKDYDSRVSFYKGPKSPLNRNAFNFLDTYNKVTPVQNPGIPAQGLEAIKQEVEALSVGADPGIIELADDFLQDYEEEENPADLLDVGAASLEYISEKFSDWGGMAAAFEDVYTADDAGCWESHPLATMGGLLAGSAYGGFTSRPLWSKILSTGYAPLGATLKAFKVANAATKKIEKVPFGGLAVNIGKGVGYLALFLSVAAPAGVYLALPDDNEELNKKGPGIASTLDDGVDGFVGLLKDTDWFPVVNAALEVFGFLKGKKGKDNKNPKTSAERVSGRVTSQLPATKEKINREVIRKLEAIANEQRANKGNINSVNCYIASVGGSFVLMNLARGTLKKTSFGIRKGLSENLNMFAEANRRIFRQLFASVRPMFKLREGNHLAAYMALKTLLGDQLTVRRGLGEIRVIGKGGVEGSISMVIVKNGATTFDKPLMLSPGHIPQQYRRKFKNFIDENGAIVIDLNKAQRQLGEITAPVYRRSLEELTSNVEGVYRTGPTASKIRRIAQLGVRSTEGLAARQVLDHYRNTAGLMKQVLTKGDDKLKQLKDKYKAIEKDLTDGNFPSEEIIEAMIKANYSAETTFKSLEQNLSFTTRIDQLKGRVIAGGANTRYDNFIKNIIEVDAMEKVMIAEFRMIDEMLLIEKTMLKKFGRMPPGTPRTFTDFLTSTTDSTLSLTLYQKYLNATNQFADYLENSGLKALLNNSYVATKAKIADEIAIFAFALNRMKDATLNYIRNIDLVQIKNIIIQEIRNNPQGAVVMMLVSGATAVALSELIRRLIKYFEQKDSGSKQIKEQKNQSSMFVQFLKNFLEDLKSPAESKKELQPWKKWSRKLQKEANFEKKIDMLFKLFQHIQENSKNLKENKGTIMKKTDLKKLVSEMLNENSGMGYSNYPYASNEYSEQEPDQDYMTEWKSLVDEVCSQKKRSIDGDPETMEDTAIEVAKLFIKDLDLFREVLEMAGSNKSIGVEIMSQLKSAKEKYSKDLKV